MTRLRRRMALAAAAAAMAQHVPLTFVLVAAPAGLRAAGTPLWLLGLFALAFLPLVLQFLWAPALEAARDRLPGGWRDWMGWLGAAMALVTAGASWVPPESGHAPALLALVVLLGGLAASQKIAVGGSLLAVLGTSDRPLANAALGAGAALGSLTGSVGLTLLMAKLGWAAACLAAAAVLVGLALLVRLAPKIPAAASAQDAPRGLVALLRASGARRLAWLLPPIALPIGLAYGMVQPRLVDAGLDLGEVGLVNGLGQVAAWLLAAPLATRAVRRLGPSRALAGGLLGAVPLLVGLGAATLLASPHSLPLAVAAAAVALLLLVGLSIALSTLLMRWAEEEHGGQPASGFSLALSLYGVFVILGAGLAGPLAEWAGYGGLLLAAALIAAPGAWCARRLGGGPDLNCIPRPQVAVPGLGIDRD